MAIRKGSTEWGVTQLASGKISTGAKVVCAGATALFALATVTASRAIAATESRVNTWVAAKPHEPPTNARRLIPNESVF